MPLDRVLEPLDRELVLGAVYVERDDEDDDERELPETRELEPVLRDELDPTLPRDELLRDEELELRLDEPLLRDELLLREARELEPDERLELARELPPEDRDEDALDPRDDEPRPRWANTSALKARKTTRIREKTPSLRIGDLKGRAVGRADRSKNDAGSYPGALAPGAVARGSEGPLQGTPGGAGGGQRTLRASTGGRPGALRPPEGREASPSPLASPG
ncbi:MAG: hypothetical protein AAF682_28190 [Planctomycetota bacterium]